MCAHSHLPIRNGGERVERGKHQGGSSSEDHGEMTGGGGAGRGGTQRETELERKRVAGMAVPPGWTGPSRDWKAWENCPCPGHWLSGWREQLPLVKRANWISEDTFSSEFTYLFPRGSEAPGMWAGLSASNPRCFQTMRSSTLCVGKDRMTDLT